MNTGQSILSIGALLLLSILILRINSTLLFTGTTVTNAKFGLIAVSLAQSRLEEIKSKAFDENTISAAASVVTALTAVSKLGPESGDAYPKFDDVDDYNKYAMNDTVIINPNLGKVSGNYEIFRDSSIVYYVSLASPDNISSTQTWHKKITVYVFKPDKKMTDTISVSSVFSYWVFR